MTVTNQTFVIFIVGNERCAKFFPTEVLTMFFDSFKNKNQTIIIEGISLNVFERLLRWCIYTCLGYAHYAEDFSDVEFQILDYLSCNYSIYENDDYEQEFHVNCTPAQCNRLFEIHEEETTARDVWRAMQVRDY